MAITADPINSTLPRVYTVKELAEALGVEPCTIRAWERAGRIPRGRRISSRVVRWTAEDLAPILRDRRD